MPPGADSKACKAFILSGGQLTSKPRQESALAVGDLAELYLANRKVEPNTLKTLTFHFNHLRRILTPEKSLNSIGLASVPEPERNNHGKNIHSYTIRKELRTFRQAWTWATEMAHTSTAPTWRLKSLEFEKDLGREPFRMYEQIMQKIKRGGLTKNDQGRLWENALLDVH